MKPNLRQAGKNNTPRNMVFVGCLLAAVYMYPMIFKPLIQSNFTKGDEEQSKELERMKVMVSDHRPSNMPEWTNPFAPKDDK